MLRTLFKSELISVNPVIKSCVGLRFSVVGSWLVAGLWEHFHKPGTPSERTVVGKIIRTVRFI